MHSLQHIYCTYTHAQGHAHTGAYAYEACIHIHTHPLSIKHTVIHIDHESGINEPGMKG